MVLPDAARNVNEETVELLMSYMCGITGSLIEGGEQYIFSFRSRWYIFFPQGNIFLRNAVFVRSKHTVMYLMYLFVCRSRQSTQACLVCVSPVGSPLPSPPTGILTYAPATSVQYARESILYFTVALGSVQYRHRCTVYQVILAT